MGHFSIGAPRLETASGRLVAQFPLTAVVSQNQIADLRAAADVLVGATANDAPDPQLEFGLGAPLRVGAIKLPYRTLLLFAVLAATAVVFSRHSANRETAVWATTASKAAALANSIAVVRPGTVVFGALVVAGVELHWLWPLHRAIDWPIWDESNYAAFGAHWFQHGGTLGEFHSSPLYMIGYGVLSVLGNLESAIFAQHYFVKLSSVVLLYLVLTQSWRSWIAAASVALLWGATQFHLEFPLLVYQFAFLWLLAAILVVDRWPLAGLAFVAWASCVRQEYQIAAGVFACCLAWRCWQSRSLRFCVATTSSRPSVWAGSIFAGALLAMIVFVALRTDNTNSDARAWFAFQQHYAVRAAATGDAPGINPWVDYPTVIQKDFPGAASMRSAWAVNSGAVLRHLRYNFAHAPSEVWELGRIHAGLNTAAWLFLGAAAAAFASGGAKDPTGRWRLSSILAACSILSIGPGLLILAKGAYLLPLLPALVIGIGVWSVALKRTAGQLSPHPRWSVGLLVVAVVLAISTNDVFAPSLRQRPVAETVTVLRQVWPQSGKFALLGAGASSYAHYLGDERCLGVEALASATGSSERHQSMGALVKEVNPLAVLITDDWKQSSEFDRAALDKILTPPTWIHRHVPAGDLYLRRGE